MGNRLCNITAADDERVTLNMPEANSVMNDQQIADKMKKNFVIFPLK